MVRFEHKAGGYSQYIFIKYVSLWDSCFKTTGIMRFLDPGMISRVTDVSLEHGEKEVRVYLYPHNKPSNLESLAEKYEEKLLTDILGIMESTESKRRAYSFFFPEDGEPRLLEPEDFRNFLPSRDTDDMFIFSNSEDDGGFPNIYMVREENKKGTNYTTFRILTASSGGVIPPVGVMTNVGKEFTYMLFNSFFEKKFTPEVPSLTSVDFPTRRDASFPKYLNVKALQSFAENQVSNNLVITDGKITYEEGKTPKKKESDEEDVDEVFGLPPTAQLAEIVLDEILNSNSVNLSDAFQLGMGKTLVLAPFTDIIIPINIDLADTAKKMCIYEGQIHLVPLSDDFDAEEFFGEPADMFHVCTEETFPKPALPSGKTEYVH